MRTVGFILIMAMFGLSAHGYRFVCNGLLANGEERNDDCGICDDEHAARWRDPTLSVVVGSKTLPKGISAEDWKSAISSSFAAWNDIGGSQLKFVEASEDVVREFGTNDSVHEIFWITDRKEWRKLVGSGEFGTLGATLPRYACGGDLGSKREIFDADLVLNGLGHINWQMKCVGDDCISVQTTLVHELGHFFGLDHPCQMCSTSIMSARAGFDLTYPVFDDIAGLRALYPDGSEGNFGAACRANGECNERHCVNDGLNRYCTNACNGDGECKNGSMCTEVETNRVCTFVDAEAAMGKDAGESCVKRPCTEPMVCAGASEENFFCYMPCDNDDACKSDEKCVKIDNEASICVTIRNFGDTCNHRDLCDERLFCVFDNAKSGRCRAPCVSTSLADSGCREGEVCELFSEGIEICVPGDSSINLDDSTDGFGQEDFGDGNFGRDQPTRKKTEQAGCSMGPTKNQNNAWLLLILLLWSIKRIIPRRKECRVLLRAFKNQ